MGSFVLRRRTRIDFGRWTGLHFTIYCQPVDFSFTGKSDYCENVFRTFKKSFFTLTGTEIHNKSLITNIFILCPFWLPVFFQLPIWYNNHSVYRNSNPLERESGVLRSVPLLSEIGSINFLSEIQKKKLILHHMICMANSYWIMSEVF